MLSSLIQSNSSKLSHISGTAVSVFTRSKHSKTQIKRIFKQHPAFIRVAKRDNFLPKAITSESPALTHQPFFEANILPNGWSAPPQDEDILKKREELPFSVKRTGNKPNNTVGFLPVYSQTRLGGTKHTTIVKKISGDKEAFLNDLRAILGIGVEDQDSIRIRASGSTYEINGNRVREVKQWLAGLGF